MTTAHAWQSTHAQRSELVALGDSSPHALICNSFRSQPRTRCCSSPLFFVPVRGLPCCAAPAAPGQPSVFDVHACIRLRVVRRILARKRGPAYPRVPVTHPCQHRSGDTCVDCVPSQTIERPRLGAVVPFASKSRAPWPWLHAHACRPESSVPSPIISIRAMHAVLSSAARPFEQIIITGDPAIKCSKIPACLCEIPADPRYSLSREQCSEHCGQGP